MVLPMRRLCARHKVPHQDGNVAGALAQAAAQKTGNTLSR